MSTPDATTSPVTSRTPKLASPSTPTSGNTVNKSYSHSSVSSPNNISGTSATAARIAHLRYAKPANGFSGDYGSNSPTSYINESKGSQLISNTRASSGSHNINNDSIHHDNNLNRRISEHTKFEQILPEIHSRNTRAKTLEGGHRESDATEKVSKTDKRSVSSGKISDKKPDDANGSNSGPISYKDQSRSRKFLGDWVLQKTIGAGSMGKVKMAHNLKTGEQAAIKIVPRYVLPDKKKSAKDENREVRTIREASLVMLLHHPYICEMKEVHLMTNHYYLVFEHVDGGQMLDYIIAHGRLKEKQARKFARQIISALAYCHCNSVVHRDLKIENILISKTGDIKIIDFGLSNLFSPKSHLTTFCGSLYFAAPELLNAHAYVGPEVDVWSFGIVLYVLVCGKVPFDDQSMAALHAKIKKGVVDYPPYLSSECKHLLSRILVTDPIMRAKVSEIINHSWMTKGFDCPPEIFLPSREPLSLPLNPDVIHGMKGFEFGDDKKIMADMTAIIKSAEYEEVTREFYASRSAPPTERKRGFTFDLIRRKSVAVDKPPQSKIHEFTGVLGPSFTAFDPLLSIYFLVREKQERERSKISNITNSFDKMNVQRKQKLVLSIPPLSAPEPSHLSPQDKTGESINEVSLAMGENSEKLRIKEPPKTAVEPHIDSLRSEALSGGLLRRWSTRRRNDKRSSSLRVMDKRLPSNVSTESPALVGPSQIPPGPSREIKNRSRSFNPPPVPSLNTVRESKASALLSKVPETAHPNSSGARVPSTFTTGTKPSRSRSLGGSVRDQYRRFQGAVSPFNRNGIDEETEDEGDEKDISKPVFLKGLFSVQTTTTKSAAVVRQDLIRVLKSLNIHYEPIKGGFNCVYRPSIDVVRQTESENINKPEGSERHRRRLISLSARERFSRDESNISLDSIGLSEVEGPPENRKVVFDVFIVRIGWLNMQGVQFKRVSGDAWTYKTFAGKILAELKL